MTATRSNIKAQGRAADPGSSIPTTPAPRPQRGQTSKPTFAQRTLDQASQQRPPHDRNAVKHQSPGSRSAPWVNNPNNARPTTATRSNIKAQGRAAHPGSRIPTTTTPRPQRGQTSKPRFAQRTLGHASQSPTPHDRNAVKHQSPGSCSAPWITHPNSDRLTTATRSNIKAPQKARKLVPPTNKHESWCHPPTNFLVRKILLAFRCRIGNTKTELH
jgi:hypothetical protein